MNYLANVFLRHSIECKSKKDILNHFFSWWTKPLLVLTFWRDSDFIRFDSKATVGGFFFTWFFFSTSTQSIIAFNLKSQHATSLKSRSLQVTKLALFGSLRKYNWRSFELKDSQKCELTLWNVRIKSVTKRCRLQKILRAGSF